MKEMATRCMYHCTVVAADLADGIECFLISPEDIVFGNFLELGFLAAFLDSDE